MIKKKTFHRCKFDFNNRKYSVGLSPIKGIGTSLLRNITANKAERNHHRSNTQNQWKETKHYLSRQQESF